MIKTIFIYNILIKNTMQYTIEYKKVKHWRVRVVWENTLRITIPIFLSKNEDIKNSLLEKGKLLLLKSKEREKNTVQSYHDDGVLVLWEKRYFDEIDGNIDMFLKEKLKKIALPFLNLYSEKIGISYTDFTIRKVKSKWWSCSGDNKIMLNLNLIHFPIEYIEYVIVHEICHLKEKNHSPRFWKLVADFFPQYKEIRKNLKKSCFM